MEPLKTFDEGKDPDAKIDYTIRWGAPAWLTATAYVYGAWVYDTTDGKFYRCIVGHTSGAARTDDKKKWTLQKKRLWLDPETDEQITTAVFTVPAGLTKESETNDGYTATVWLSGGTAGTTYKVTCRITTDNATARIDDRTIEIPVVER